MLRELRKGVEVISVTGTLSSQTIGRNGKTGHVNGKCGEEVMNNKIGYGTMTNSYTCNLQCFETEFVSENT